MSVIARIAETETEAEWPSGRCCLFFVVFILIWEWYSSTYSTVQYCTCEAESSTWVGGSSRGSSPRRQRRRGRTVRRRRRRSKAENQTPPLRVTASVATLTRVVVTMMCTACQNCLAHQSVKTAHDRWFYGVGLRQFDVHNDDVDGMYRVCPVSSLCNPRRLSERASVSVKCPSFRGHITQPNTHVQ